MLKAKWRLCLSIAVMGIISMFTVHNVYASSVKANYAVIPKFEGEQRGKRKDMFSFVWTPGKKENIQLEIVNYTDKEQEYVIQLNTVCTNDEGKIEYKTPAKNTEENKLISLIQLPKKIKVAKYSSKVLEGSLQLPNQNFVGDSLAGIHISEAYIGGQKNSLVYDIPVSVQGGEEEKKVANIKLQTINVRKARRDVYTLYADFKNNSSHLLKDVVVSMQLKDKNGKEVLKQYKKIDIVPKSLFSIPINSPRELGEGSYSLEAEINNGSYKWNLHEDFDIDVKQALKLKKSFHKTRKIVNSDSLIISLSVAIVILIILLCI
ncbi:hypothetical protein IGJ41_002746 [Enterococcus sp. DIV1537a]|uniref:WxL protein peptidoglycan domain-containing protein n=1 Tax=Enterococcus sp. DIV1537a TaxID=2774733 RepID=UPI003F2173E4